MAHTLPIIALGVDGGGTGTRAMLTAADGTVLGVGSGGPSNLVTQGVDLAAEQVILAVRNAWADARLPSSAAPFTFIGLAGARASGSGLRLRELLAQAGVIVVDRTSVGSDYENVLAGGLGGRPGVALLVGTGSYCVARDATGNLADCGGWGWLLDDVGGGTFLGREALQAVVRSADGRNAATSMTPLVLTALGVASPRELPAALQAVPSTPSLLASLAPIVLGQARAGDLSAKGILERGAAGLAELVRHATASLTWAEAPACVIAGGLGRSGDPYQPQIEQAVTASSPALRIIPPQLPNVAGAALRALNAAGMSSTPALLERLRDGATRRATS